MSEPAPKPPVNQIASGKGIPVQAAPPPADDEFVGSKVNNPFRRNLTKPQTNTNPFHNRFEPEG